MAVAYEYLKDYANVAATYEKLVQKFPDNPEGYYGGSRAFYLSGNIEKGLDYAFKAYKIYKEQQSPYINDAQQILGSFYNDLKDKGQLDLFEKVAKDNGINITD